MSKENSSEGKSKNWFARHKIMTAILMIFVIIIVSAIIGSGDDNSTSNTSSNQPSQKVVTPEMTVTAAELLTDYNANEVAADNKYEGKLIEISGTIKSIGMDILDTPYISFESNDLIFGVQCMFNKADSEQLVSLSTNQRVTVTGKVSGKLGNVIVRECQLK